MSEMLLKLNDVHLNFPARKNWRGKVVERVYALNGLDITAYRGETWASSASPAAEKAPLQSC
jgi:peptide/nickel transport system ATP-binding protein